MAKSITVKFVDFWAAFNPYDNKILRALEASRNVVVLPSDSREEPDILFYSRCGVGEHFKYQKSVKVFYTGENDYPNFNECDYAISHHEMDADGRNLRYPLYALGYDETAMETNSGRGANADATPLERGFCSMVMSHSRYCDPRRIAIADALEEYKPIAYGGAFRNNVGGRVKDKIDFVSNYKFDLALENSHLDGYVTEKIADSFRAHSVPIYWGGKLVRKDFNPESFINVDDYHNIDSFVRGVKEIDGDDSRYLAMLNAPSHMKDTVEDFDAKLADFLSAIADNPRIYRTDYGEMGRFKRHYSVVHPLAYASRSYIKLSRIIGRLKLPSYFRNLPNYDKQ